MNFFENVASAFQNVRGNKMRSVLTMLGIIIGIGSVIVILSLGAGVKGAIFSTLSGINTNMIQVTAWNVPNFEGLISLEDAENIKQLDNVENVTANLWIGNQRLKLRIEGEYKTGEINGIDENYRTVMEELDILHGRVFSENDIDNRLSVALINEQTAIEAFGYTDCIGKEIDVESDYGTYSFTVVGVLAMAPDALGATNTPAKNSLLLVPVTTLQDMIYYEDKLDYLGVSVKDPSKAVETAKRITDLLAQTHELPPEDSYYAEPLSTMVGMVDSMLSVVTAFVAFVAFISLFVGGVGVMNIMLVTVTERTREIGIRKSLGATNGNIRLLFVMEALILTSFGGFVGILFGQAASSGICAVLTSMMGLPVTPSIDVTVVAAAVFVSSLVGVVFGVYPASKAAKLNPIESLRYE